MITVGTNSYVSVVDADEFINTYYAPTEELAVWWNGLDAGDQELYLLRSARYIDRLPFVGWKTVYSQTMAFPRSDELTVPTEVIEAQIINAHFVSLPVANDPSRSNVKSYSIGDLSETFFSPNTSLLHINSEALDLLKEWMTGGFAIV